MSRSRLDELLSMAIAESSLVRDGNYTLPASWGVYQINLPPTSTTRRFRMGNHPVRQHELVQEFGTASLVAIFTVRAHAVELAALCNHGRS